MNKKLDAYAKQRGIFREGLAASTAISQCLALGLLGGIAFSGAASAQQAESSDMTFEEIVVTSRKRSESMMDIPMSINVVSEGLIEKMGASNYTDLLASVPSLTAYQNGPGRTRLVIRGVANTSSGANDNDTQNQETVGIYLDEIPISTGALNPELGLFDLERVEVLRGPQGTLYGAGSMTGTIRLVSKKPNLREFEGKVDASLSTINKGSENYDVKALVNIPVVEDRFALRTSAYYEKNGGYIDNVLTGEKDINHGRAVGARVSARLQLSEAFTADFSFFHHDYSDNGRPEDLDHTPLFSRDYPSNDGYDDEMQIYNLTLNYDLGWGEIVSSTSYFDRKVVNRRSLDLLFETLPPQIVPHELIDTTDTDVFVQEIRLASQTESPLQWTVGAYLDKKDVLYLNTFPVPGADAILGDSSNFGAPKDHLYYGYDDLEVKTYALFGEAYYTWDKFTFTAGLRYFNWKQDIEFYQSGLFNGGANSDVRPQNTVDGVNPKFNISYQINDDNLVYVQMAKGFRYGGINGAIPEAVCADELAQVEREGGDTRFFNPDKTWNYEIGSKNTLADGRVTLNASYFHIKWQDMQTSRGFECGFGFKENVGEATSQGIELELNARVTENLSLYLGGTYINSELAQDVPNLGAEEGDKAPFVPEFAFNTSADYVRPLTDTMDGFIWANVQYVGERNSHFSDDDANFRAMDGYFVSNLRVGTRWDNLELSVFANNLFDGRGVIRAMRRPPFDPDATIKVEPRTIGVSLRANF